MLPKKLEQVGFKLTHWTPDELLKADDLTIQIVGRILDEEFWPPGDPEWKDFDDFEDIVLSEILEYVEEPGMVQ